MTIQDQVVLSLTAWKENRGGLIPGMQSVMNVILNRVTKRATDAYTECLRPKQFTSMTVAGPEAILWPSDNDPQWQAALQMAQRASTGTLPDLTGGATLYYAPAAIQTTVTITLPNGFAIPFPEGWNKAAVKYTATIANQVFFTEQ
jgi:hypothetical protein